MIDPTKTTPEKLAEISCRLKGMPHEGVPFYIQQEVI